MAFCDLTAVTAYDEKNGITYVIGDVFATYSHSSDVPLVYSWDLVKYVDAAKHEIKFGAGTKTFSVHHKMFKSDEDYIKAIAIIEYMHGKYNFGYKHEHRIFPLKSQYRECPPGKEHYTGEAILDEAEIASAFLTMLNFKLIKLLWLVAILIAIVVVGVLHLTIGITRDNVLYFVPISLVSGGIFAVLVYITTHLIARAKVRKMCSSDPSTKQVITFVISRAGFATCESCIYQGRDLVPWSEVEYFVESDKMFIMYKNNAPAAFIPKKAFEKKQVSSVADIIALHLEQR